MSALWSPEDSDALDRRIKAERRKQALKRLPPVLSTEDARKIEGYAVKEPFRAFNVGRRKRNQRQVKEDE